MGEAVVQARGLLVGVADGIAASAAFTRVWTLVTGQQDTPKTTDHDRS
jgi:hypothetical protein